MRRDDAKAAYRLEFSYTPEIVDEMMRSVQRRSQKMVVWFFGFFSVLIALTKLLSYLSGQGSAIELAYDGFRALLPVFAICAFASLWLYVRVRTSGRRQLRRSPLMRYPIAVSMGAAGLRYESKVQQVWSAWPVVQKVSVTRNLILLWLGGSFVLPLPKALLDEDAETVVARIERWRAEPFEEKDAKPG